MAFPYIQAADHRVGRVRPIRGIMLHVVEADLRQGVAEAVAEWFSHPGNYSAHYSVDAWDIVQMVQELDTAFACPGFNADFIHIEFCTREDTADWNETNHQLMLQKGAALVNDIRSRFPVPAIHLSLPQCADNSTQGLASHWDGTNAYPSLAAKYGSHHDGRRFPWEQFLGMVTNTASIAPAVSPKPSVDWVAIAAAIAEAKKTVLLNGDSGWKVKYLQTLLNNQQGSKLVLDGMFGKSTDNAVRWWQNNHGLTVDGIVGPKTWNSFS